jgi:hypothetical protein
MVRFRKSRSVAPLDDFSLLSTFDGDATQNDVTLQTIPAGTPPAPSLVQRSRFSTAQLQKHTVGRASSRNAAGSRCDSFGDKWAMEARFLDMGFKAQHDDTRPETNRSVSTGCSSNTSQYEDRSFVSLEKYATIASGSISNVSTSSSAGGSHKPVRQISGGSTLGSSMCSDTSVEVFSNFSGEKEEDLRSQVEAAAAKRVSSRASSKGSRRQESKASNGDAQKPTLASPKPKLSFLSRTRQALTDGFNRKQSNTTRSLDDVRNMVNDAIIADLCVTLSPKSNGSTTPVQFAR